MIGGDSTIGVVSVADASSFIKLGFLSHSCLLVILKDRKDANANPSTAQNGREKTLLPGDLSLPLISGELWKALPSKTSRRPRSGSLLPLPWPQRFIDPAIKNLRRLPCPPFTTRSRHFSITLAFDETRLSPKPTPCHMGWLSQSQSM